MNRTLNRLVRAIIQKVNVTGVEQELNRADITGQLTVPELSAAARQMAAEGIVLLKNERQTLPLRAEDTVAVFGRTAVDYFAVGYGSGGDVIPPYKTGLTDALRQSGVTIDEALADRYERWRSVPKNMADEGFWGHWPRCYPEMPLTKADVAQAAKTATVALVVIGRAAGEDRENLLKKGSFYLTDLETRMLDLVTDAFARVCVILDCGNIIDMSWTLRYGERIGALLYAWQGGMESGFALSDVLTGAVDPSGRLTDTIAEKYADYPSSGHFGGKKFNEYVEDIYVGYRYFETFRPERVLYPFGFGLSYTDFSVRSEASVDGDEVTVCAHVKNIGGVSGRQVVQTYLGLPQGKLGNPARVLAGFAKTGTLAPGEEQTLTMRFDLKEFAPYDDGDATGFRFCHVLEAGTYRVFAGVNVRDAEPVLRFERAETQVVKRLRQTLAVRPECAFRRLTNRDGAPTLEDVPTAYYNLRKQIVSELPEELSPAGDEPIPFSDVLEGRASVEAFTAQLSPEELDDLTHGEGKMNSAFGILGNAGAFGGVTESLRKRGVPAVITTDGPSGIRIKRTVALLPCGTALASSFDPEGVEALYALVSREMAVFDVDMLLAPGMNIHRNPLCGRNFEYYSEDPVLTGKIAAAAVRGIQRTGRSACPKHFACNSQERFRTHNDSRVSERALREIYLKGFEIVVRESAPRAIMTSYNKINGVWSHYNYELAADILRREWGYKGVVITDWWMRPDASQEFPNIRNDAYRVRAQVDVLMPGEFGRKGDPDARALLPSLRDPNGVTLAEAQQCALHVLRFVQELKRAEKMHADEK